MATATAIPTTLSASPLPPGHRGIPWLGDAYAILRNPAAFLTMRQGRYGNVFRAAILGRPAVFLTGDAARQALCHPANVTRLGGRALPLHTLFCDMHLATHRITVRHWGLRELLFKAATPDALASYAERLGALASTYAEAGAPLSPEAWVPQLKRFALEGACGALLGWSPAKVAALHRDYDLLASASVALPLPWPGSPFARGHRARKRILAALRQAVYDQRRHPSDTGLHRILSAQRHDGLRLNDAEAALELHHLLLFAYGLFAPVSQLLRLLENDPARHATLHAECTALSQADSQSAGVLGALPILNSCIDEAHGTTAALIPLLGGTAARTFEVDGWRIPAGWDIYLDGRQTVAPGLGVSRGARNLAVTLRLYLAQLLLTALMRASEQGGGDQVEPGVAHVPAVRRLVGHNHRRASHGTVHP